MRVDINTIAEVTLSQKAHTYLREETNVVNYAETSDYVTGISRGELEALETSSVPREIRNLDLNSVTNLPPPPQSRDRWYCVFWRKGAKAPNQT